MLWKRGTRVILQKHVQKAFFVTEFLAGGQEGSLGAIAAQAAVTERNTDYCSDSPSPRAILWNDGVSSEEINTFSHWRVNQWVRNCHKAHELQTALAVATDDSCARQWADREHIRREGGKVTEEAGGSHDSPDSSLVKSIANMREGHSSWRSFFKPWLKSHWLPRT